MRGIIKVNTNEEVKIIYSKDNKSIMDIIKNEIDPEFVYPKNLNSTLCMIVDDDGYRKDLDINEIGSYYYGSYENNHFILGDIFITKLKRDSEGISVDWLDDSEILKIIDEITMIINLKI